MTTSRSWHVFAAAFLGLLASSLGGWGATAYCKADRVNVRSRPGFVGEIITQLVKGQSVTVLDTVTLRRPAADEPPIWLKIELPPETPVWANAEYVERGSGKVTADMLNVRAGPTYDHGIVARAKRGSVVKILAPEKDGWIQIGSPAGSTGFVPASWLAATREAVAAAAAGPPASVPPGAASPTASPATASASPQARATNGPAATGPKPTAALPVTAGSPTNAVPAGPAASSVTPPPPVAVGSARTNATAVPSVSPPPTRGGATNNAWLEQFVAPKPAATPVGASRPEPAKPTEPAKRGDEPAAAAPAKPAGDSDSAGKATAERTEAASPTPEGAAPAEVTNVEEPEAKPRRSTPQPSPKAAATVRRLVPAGSGTRSVTRPASGGRWVRREGIVVRPTNITAPSFYALKAREGGKVVNFLISPSSGPEAFREYRGRVVIVTGREYLDRRAAWRDTPLLDVESIEAVR